MVNTYKTTNVTFLVNGNKLAGTLFAPFESTKKLPAIVLFHGRGSSKSRYIHRAQQLADNGFVTFIFDFRGCGESEGDFAEQTIADGFEDALAGYDFLAQQPHVDKNRIGIFGSSFGGFMAALVSAKRPVKSLILSAAAMYKDEWWDKSPEELKGKIYLYFKNTDHQNTKTIKSVEQFNGNLLVIAHGNDEIIPETLTHEYYEVATHTKQKKLVTIRNAPHAINSTEFIEESEKICLLWFKKTV